MGEAFLCRRGGTPVQNAAGGYAIICVRYPALSNCSCAKGTEIYSVQNGSGTTAFAVSTSGTWTVTVSDGTHSSSGSVGITSGGEIKTIQLSYSNEPLVSGETALLSAGSGLASGFSLGGNASMNGNAIQESGDGGFWITPAVDLSGYSRLTVSGVLLSAVNSQSRISVGSTTGKVSDLLQSPEVSATWNGFQDMESTLTVDISSLNGAYYIGSTRVGNNLRITGITLS